MTYRRIIEGLGQTVVESSSDAEANPLTSIDHASPTPSSLGVSGRDDSVDEEIHHYTRVQIQAQLLLLSNERQGTADTSDNLSNDKASIEALRQMFKTRGIAKDIAEEDQRRVDAKMQAMGYAISPPTPTRLRSSRSEDHGFRPFHSKFNESEFAQISATSAIMSPTVDLKPTGAGEWANSKASRKIIKNVLEILKTSARINKDTSSAEPLDMPTKVPVPQPSGGGWCCHSCRNINNPTFPPDRCVNCQHRRCEYCSRF